MHDVIFVDRRGNRKDMVIATKVRFNQVNPQKPNNEGLSRKHILDAVEGSLKRLQTDYIDLYQVMDKEQCGGATQRILTVLLVQVVL